MKKQIIPSVAGILIRDGRILLVRHEKQALHLTGMYGLPGGRITDGENDIEAIAREFKEETGLSVIKKDFLHFADNYYVAKIPRKGGTVDTFGWTVFKVKNFSGELKAGPETTPEWIEISMLSALEAEGKLLPNTIKAIKAANSS
jgi:ADP-ribose pyrophosphatase YjhB (NUDIX family)